MGEWVALISRIPEWILRCRGDSFDCWFRERLAYGLEKARWDRFISEQRHILFYLALHSLLLVVGAGFGSLVC